MGHLKRPDPLLQIHFEEWILCKSGVLTFSLEELNQQPSDKIDHFLGFELGKKQKEKGNPQLPDM